VSIASTFGKPLAFYGMGEGQVRTVVCPDCGYAADPLFGDHDGDCLDMVAGVTPGSALSIIRRAAMNHERFSSNDLREAFEKAGVRETRRGPAFAAAKKRGWVEQDGYVRSTDGATKGHPVATYRSLIHPEVIARTVAASKGAGA
jgi:hypothetical protein